MTRPQRGRRGGFATPPLTLSFHDSAEPDVVLVNVKHDGHAESVYFRSSGPPLRRSGEALLCMGLVPAMELGCPLIIEAPIDRDLLANGKRIQALFCDWYPGYAPIAIEAEETNAAYPGGRGTGVFFSSGVDSCYSLAVERDRIDGLVTLIGADVDPCDRPAVNHLTGLARNVADAFNRELIVVETNVRSVFDRKIGWIEYHGSVLATARHLLADRFSHQLIASSGDDASWQRAWGSHPGLDPLFGATGATTEHHGLVARPDKIARILEEPALMANLRICDKRRENCGACAKCTFAMYSLDLLGGLDRAPTFPKARLGEGRLLVDGPSSLSDMRDLRKIARASGRRDIEREAERAMRRYERETLLSKILPVPEIARKFKRWKRQGRYRREAA